ncbi:Serine/threonine protein phosphatase 2A 55 kDa regulatory subunit B alpha isoform [Camellia lanceoleosa]|uniref:Serine/threonine protein phosphatase 2A 55 kDa regulatory subunit B alpha isoform n=1 Tax=Camellia lanceoleosa TaxID=1840588 RepID=A0ACC0IXH9_9ERIC|nr:Serine/threonine protein phosphatase 2A 55 kDa regulatory subunit B alpha isoform [Camellia lanceoleosa]
MREVQTYSEWVIDGDWIYLSCQFHPGAREESEIFFDMNINSFKAAGNGDVANSSGSSSLGPYLANGGNADKSYHSLSDDFLFPPGGISSLHLHAVTSHETSLMARCRRVYAHARDYHINSISNNGWLIHNFVLGICQFPDLV